ncbi:unnamed protein product [Somion occarium]|uniref:DUF6534 domain-containing protein n=1 Tax=Somion occarium TaxID=3059160 RepID=A0ABP1DLQ2_9APHY
MYSRSTDSVSHPSWNLIAGPPFVGFILNWGLLGVLLVQVYIYHISFPKDQILFKCLVYGIFMLDTLQTCMLTVDMFDNFIYRWGSAGSFSTIGMGWFSFIILGGIISAAVQLTFSWRLWILAKSKVLTGTVATLALTQLGGSIVGGAQLKSSSGTSQQSRSNVALTVWLAGSALVDVIIAIAMTFLLLRSKKNHKLVESKLQGQNQLSHSLINRLIFFVVETGTMTATVAIVAIVTFLAMPQTYVHECPAIILAKLYSNTLLAGFNNRAMMERVEPEQRKSIAISSVIFTPSADAPAGFEFVTPGQLESGFAENRSLGSSSLRSSGLVISVRDVRGSVKA